MRHALFIAFHFPPEASSSGVLRTLKYVRYLHDYGWRTTVVAPDVDAYDVTDAALERQLPRDTRVVRTRWLNTKKHLSIFGRYPSLLALPDAWIGWLPWALRAAHHVVDNDRPNVIYSTSPHASAHVIALRIARRARIPWVADFRDPWYEEPPEPGSPSGPVFLGLNARLERRVIERCSHVVAATAQLRDTLRTRYANVQQNKFSAIPNGYDEADFAGLQTFAATAHERLAIVHAGSINADFRDPRPLLRAIRDLVACGTVDPRRIVLRFVGGGAFAQSAAIKQALQETRLGDAVEFVDRMPYERALRELASASVLLLLQASNDTVTLVPAKMFEYLRIGVPVLALTYPGATTELIQLTGGGLAVDPRDDNALRDALTKLYRAWQADDLGAIRPDRSALQRFDRRVLSGELAQLFDRVQATATYADH